MKNIQNWDQFNEGLVGDILGWPVKLLNVLIFKPLVKLALLIMGKTLSIENRWEILKSVLDGLVKVEKDFKKAKQTLENDKGALTPNKKRELQAVIDKFNKTYPNGFDLDQQKVKLVTEIKKAFVKSSNESDKEDLEWIIGKIESYRGGGDKPINKGSLSKQLDDMLKDAKK